MIAIMSGQRFGAPARSQSSSTSVENCISTSLSPPVWCARSCSAESAAVPSWHIDGAAGTMRSRVELVTVVGKAEASPDAEDPSPLPRSWPPSCPPPTTPARKPLRWSRGSGPPNEGSGPFGRTTLGRRPGNSARMVRVRVSATAAASGAGATTASGGGSAACSASGSLSPPGASIAPSASAPASGSGSGSGSSPGAGAGSGAGPVSAVSVVSVGSVACGGAASLSAAAGSVPPESGTSFSSSSLMSEQKWPGWWRCASAL